jgi:hypothetical protein
LVSRPVVSVLGGLGTALGNKRERSLLAGPVALVFGRRLERGRGALAGGGEAKHLRCGSDGGQKRDRDAGGCGCRQERKERERAKKRGKKEKENEQFLNPSMFIG